MARKHASKPSPKLVLRELFASAPVLLAGVIAFAVAIQVSVAGECRTTRPIVALRLMPVDAEARARLASQLAANSPSPDARAAARELAQNAVLRSPLAPIAIRALAQLRANDGSSSADQGASRLFGEVERLTRRDNATQIWLVEHYLRRALIPEAVRHLDIALRTWSTGEATLFPVLAVAAGDKRVADALISRMKSRPGWALPFASYMIGQMPAEVSSYILGRTLDPRIDDEKALIGIAMWRYASTGDYEAAVELHDRFQAGDRIAVDANQINGGGFETDDELPPFGWSYVQESGLWAAPEALPDRNRALLLSASSGKSGELARQLLQLRPGRYRLTARSGEVPLEIYQRPTLTVRCAGDDNTTLASAKPDSDRAGAGSINRTFSVDGSCRFQWITISLTGPEIDRGERPWVDDVSIVQVDGPRVANQ